MRASKPDLYYHCGGSSGSYKRVFFLLAETDRVVSTTVPWRNLANAMRLRVYDSADWELQRLDSMRVDAIVSPIFLNSRGRYLKVYRWRPASPVVVHG